MSFDSLFAPVEHADEWLMGLFEGAPLLVALGIALVLGLRHASDPDHLVAVTSLMASDDADSKAAVRLGAWWGLGHAAMLLAIGLPLIAFKSELPTWLETAAERAVGVVILVLALRVIWKWVRGDYRMGPHAHPPPGHTSPDAPAPSEGRPRALARPAGRSDPTPGIRDRPPSRPRGHRRRRPAPDRRAPDAARGGARACRVRADVDPLDGGAHGSVRLDPHAPGGRADLPKRADPGARGLRRALRPLVRRPHLSRLSSA